MPRQRRTAKRIKLTVESISRARQALALRKQGLTLRQIAEHLGVSHQRVGLYIKRALDEVIEKRRDEAGELLDQHIAQLEEKKKLLEPRIQQGQLTAIDAWRKLHKDVGELRGLYEMKLRLSGNVGVNNPHDTILERLARLAASLAAGSADPKPQSEGG